MAYRDVVAGVDIGNSTTEAVLMRVCDGHCDFLSYIQFSDAQIQKDFD